ncbi:hypothetical protein [Nonomuraea bangladeshensis]|uniref:hypothetical protein n=1 Tax=Nonomuraea bangladeshensis TaxID=404385 RepID=UPI0031CE7864
MNPQQTLDRHLSDLRASFPDWAFFRSDPGAFYATRRGVVLTDAEIDAGLEQPVSADDEATFVALLHEQHVRGWSRGRATA